MPVMAKRLKGEGIPKALKVNGIKDLRALRAK
jgi:hypothetical protein